MKKHFREAIEQGRTDVVEERLAKYPRWANHTFEDGLTPLMVALFNTRRNLRCIRALVEAGADVKQSWILHWAVGGTDYHMGARSNQYIPLLVQAGAPLENVNLWGWTPLMNAVIKSAPYDVCALLNVGANPNKTVPKDGPHGSTAWNQGQSILSASWSNCNPVATMKALLAAGADVSMRDDFGRTALEFFHGIPIEKYRKFDHYERFAAVRLKCIQLLQQT